MQHIRVEIKNAIATITIDRPDCHNAIDDTTIHELHESILALSQDANVRLLQITGAGKSFCAGADIRWMQRMVKYSEAENIRDATALANMLTALSHCPYPTIALVNGPAIGGGAGLVAACDIAIAVDSAFCQFTEVKIGLIPAVISPYVIQTIGARAAQYYFLTTEKIEAAAAKQLGLFQHVVPPEHFTVVTSSICNTLLKNSPAALAACKKLLRELPCQNQESVNEMTATAIAKIRVSAEGQEGLNAFLEKRKPGWITEHII